MTSWKFAEAKPRVGAESALDACDYFGDEVIEPWKVLGTRVRIVFNWKCLHCCYFVPSDGNRIKFQC